jgi:4-aminobutyrate aminotransferase-like enzyme/Ser/Thr protein kinase RdoA (MazF antagonist)
LNTHHFTTRDASRIANDLYNLRASAQVLPGELDHNFHLRDESGQEFVLKIAHAEERKTILDLQNTVLERLAARDSSLLLPRVRATRTNETIATITADDGTSRFVRLLTYIPGRLFANVKPHTPALLHSLGALLGRMDRALQDFSHPAARRAIKWDLQGASWIRDYLPYIEQPARRAIVEGFLARFETEALPVIPALRASVIHGDANNYNVLVSEISAEPARVISVIDFGDMLHTCTVSELAVAAAYAMLGKADPLAAAAEVVAGYHVVFPLTGQELAVLYPLICARLCISVVNSAYQRQVEPRNDYLTISEQPAWKLLEQLVDVHPRLAHYTFRHACRLTPCPNTDAVVQWLENNPDKLGRVVEPDLRAANKVIFDLSIGSRELGNLVELSDVQWFTRQLFARMEASQSSVGIGRYNEARPIYTGNQYRVAGNDGPEWRTVHTGLDIFMEVGAPILAPLDGVVHSFRNNDTPLDYGPTIILQHTITSLADNDLKNLPNRRGEGGEERRGGPLWSPAVPLQDAKPDLTFYTLYGHLSEDSLAGLYVGEHIARGTSFARIGSYEVNGGWPPHLHFQLITDLLDREGEFPGVALPSQRGVWLSLSPDPNLVTRIPAQCFPANGLSVEQILEARAERIGGSLSISYQNPLKIVRGSMQYLYDARGRAYLDAVNNVCHVGHCHPRVVKAGQQQMAVLNTNTRYLHEDLVRYAERLCSLLPAPLSVCFFVCSGSEANELALRLARTHTQRKDIVVVDAAYHGNTSTLVEISPYKFDGPGGTGAPPYVHVAPMPDVYRGKYKRNDPRAGEKYALHIKEVLQQSVGAAFICESLLGCGGQIVLPDNYLKEAYRHVRNAGGVCIADEVQVGFGRAGTHFWGFETQGVVPDIVTLGKPIGNGHPLAAVVTTHEIAASFNNGMEYFNTYGGNPVSCAIGLAVLDVIEEEQLQQNALRVGTRLMDGLRELMEKHTLIGDVRGLGLFVGIELVLDRQTLAPAAQQASYIVNRASDRGILLSTDGPLHNVLKIKPPLVFTKANADYLVATLDDILGEDLAIPP